MYLLTGIPSCWWENWFNMGNASNWANAAASSGYTVNNTPKVGAIMQTTQGYYGHVAYVEGVNSNGSVRVSEMNDGHGAGVVTSYNFSKPSRFI